MKAEETSVVRRVFERKISRLAIIGFVVIILVGGLFLFKMLKSNSNSKTTTSTQQTAIVRRGSIGVTISGSGSITSSNRVDVSPAVNGTVTKVYFKEGDTVKAGDVMFEIDNSNALANVENIKNNILQNELNQSTGNNDLSKLTIKAPFSGQVTVITPAIGDVLNKGATLCTITDESKLKITLPFTAEDAKSIKSGSAATVNLQDIMESVSGKVASVSKYSYSSANGDLYNVEITIDNPGALKSGMKANVDIDTSKGTVSSTDIGTLSPYNNQIIKTDTGGTVKAINVQENQTVKAGDVLFEFDNNDMVVSSQLNDLKTKNLQTQLSDAEKTLNNYIIKAPISGEITVQSTIVGNVVNSGTVISTIADTGHMQFEVPVDELDIAKVKVGQAVNITVDALAETTTKPLTGKVSKVAIEGTSTNGVTTYPVTIQVDQAENLKGGMNVNAEISISQKDDVLYVPIEAVTKIGNRALVMVKADAKTVAAMKNGQGNFFGARARGNGNGYGNGNSSGNSNGNSNGNSYRNSNRNAGGYSNGNNGGYGNAGGYGRNSTSGSGASSNGSNSNRRQGAFGLMNNPYYANAVPKMVEIGINNENYIEIVSGLNEGDEVILPPVVAAKASSTATTGGFGGLGGLGGGGGMQRNFGGGNGGYGGNNGGNSSRSSGSSSSRSSGNSGSNSGGNSSRPQSGD